MKETPSSLRLWQFPSVVATVSFQTSLAGLRSRPALFSVRWGPIGPCSKRMLSCAAGQDRGSICYGDEAGAAGGRRRDRCKRPPKVVPAGNSRVGLPDGWDEQRSPQGDRLAGLLSARASVKLFDASVFVRTE